MFSGSRGTSICLTFLYRTKTILRNVSSSPEASRTSKSTLTQQERETFGKLLGSPPTKKPSKPTTPEEEARTLKYNSLYNKIFSEPQDGVLEQRESIPWDEFQVPEEYTEKEHLGKAQNHLSTSMNDAEAPLIPPTSPIIQRKDYQRLAKALENAKTGAELVQVMEKRVFPLIGKKSQREATRAIYGPLVALAANQLLNVFRSPLLISGLYSKVYDSGIMSRVLGTSSVLYNALIKARGIWMNDFAGVDEALTEMEGQGIEFNSTTLAVLDRIIADADWEKEELRRSTEPRVGGVRLSGLLGQESVARMIAWRDKVARILNKRKEDTVQA